jgi:hypothetical protein
MYIPTGLFIITTTGSLFGGIMLGMAFLHFSRLGKLKSRGEEKRKKEEEYRQKIDEWRTNLEKQGYEIEPSKRIEGRFEVEKIEKITGSVKDFYNTVVSGLHGSTDSAKTILKLKQYRPEPGKDVKVHLYGTPPVRKGLYLEAEIWRRELVKPFEEVKFEPLDEITSHPSLYNEQVLYISLKETPGSKSIWTLGKYKPKVDRELTEFK